MKIKCRKCNKYKPRSEYYAHHHNRSGYDSLCKKCVSIKNHNRYVEKKNNRLPIANQHRHDKKIIECQKIMEACE